MKKKKRLKLWAGPVPPTETVWAAVLSSLSLLAAPIPFPTLPFLLFAFGSDHFLCWVRPSLLPICAQAACTPDSCGGEERRPWLQWIPRGATLGVEVVASTKSAVSPSHDLM